MFEAPQTTLARPAVYWKGPLPVTCDMCGEPFAGRKFVDGATKPKGRWGIMGLGCHRVHGLGLGTGKGQLYERQDDGRYLKIEG